MCQRWLFSLNLFQLYKSPSELSWWWQRSLSLAGILGWVTARGRPCYNKSICCPRPSHPSRSSKSNAAVPLLSFPVPLSEGENSPRPLTCSVSKFNFCFMLPRSHELKLSTVPRVRVLAAAYSGKYVIGELCKGEPLQQDSKTSSVFICITCELLYFPHWG